ncbi:hypothetical protein ALC53_00798 [Atta colombica]|uniref:Uncharacterized protein n=1 Tax=Atta colombica TaxID=520822 RepID=A0A195BWJ4_9HYME|nr:hypothetical protein ALC53_00798 [Atta colombica]
MGQRKKKINHQCGIRIRPKYIVARKRRKIETPLSRTAPPRSSVLVADMFQQRFPRVDRTTALYRDIYRGGNEHVPNDIPSKLYDDVFVDDANATMMTSVCQTYGKSDMKHGRGHGTSLCSRHGLLNSAARQWDDERITRRGREGFSQLADGPMPGLSFASSLDWMPFISSDQWDRNKMDTD